MKHIVIPARYQSSRLPGKPLLNIHGRPMILRVVDQAKKVQGFDDLCVATDDERIAAVCRAEGVDVVLTNPNHPSGTDRLSEVARIKGWDADDIIVNVQGDEPLLPAKLVQQVAELLIEKPQCSMSTLCEPIHHLQEFQKDSIVKVVMSNRNEALYFSRSPIPYDRDGAKQADLKLHAMAFRHLGLYAYRVKLLQEYVTWDMGSLEKLESLEQLRVLENGHRIAIDVAQVNLPPGVDTQEDLDRLNAMAVEHFE
ncbi:3-deoxy-manno-octulosonate cytidylyltransferase [Acinetobacter gerneri]|jgi:3-deoxy-manno-octulosonate cytidylyltransferase (CMP-KDO synthetase)|uniref:3-deoxy-manno-octulosonate cytidylyltransferase n=2 Tax=Acinetobacter gerneri TaxID=202952 RepID=N8ZRS6_9GAMM|nr:3-deoxy-manno-octulosonate cytidylyltransferase [Acinetobacter gerneri]ENV34185.1 3-deoxy-manno-octulosonate cytidylyltransferase [Acinetobacter gerneri DSM 14967 = CIP 107464 = MTCC 9824]EPR84618.1 3-deoxy-manno-octulosonate cytidylyltransferase [Acinetobacter gerneri DSM 14967 = CIP 107464 = MTCC 9824]MCH4245125.1 3-deoxy-manno-octulosonate cytidylyltransferase [Acinetobacter gerneri]MDQ9011310.1 3-deoxy-manno-octulosonate cytidylyltransferase [Acinetobacter gerneri]MDQ9015446.1 3-deoxy-m